MPSTYADEVRAREIAEARQIDRAEEQCDYIETATGMEITLTWSDDETMVTLHIARPNLAGGHDEINMAMTGLQIDELRSFLTERLF